MPRSHLLGAFLAREGERRLTYLDRLEPVTPDLLGLAGDVPPTQVLRFAAPCVSNGCAHFDGERCRLATRITQRIPTAVDEVPECALRPSCRWRRQEGDAACLRCPIIITESYGAEEADEALRLAADPATPV
jgi:hypothetical protein